MNQSITLNTKRVSFKCKIITQPILKNNNYRMRIKHLKTSQHYFALIPQKNNKQCAIKYGDICNIKGKQLPVTLPTNPGQFNYKQYLIFKNVQGLIKIDRVKKIKNGYKNPFKRIAFYLKDRIIKVNKSCFPKPYDALYTGLVFGDQGVNLPDELSEQFQRTGLMHLLVVSGAQVALISGILLAILSTTNCHPFAIFCLMTLTNITFYFLTGGGLSIQRAIIMCEISCGLRLLNRNTNIFHILALSAFIMLLINPISIFDMGGLLSFNTTFALLFCVPIMTKWLPKNWPIIIKNTIAISLAPTLFSMPLCWYSFQNISPIAFISNCLVFHWIELLVVIGFFASMIGCIFLPLAFMINQFSLLLMKLLHQLVIILDKTPFACINIHAPPLILILLIYCMMLMILNEYEKKSKKWMRISIVILLISLFFFYIPKLLPNQYLKVSFLDVGQGDSILIETPNNKTFLIDGGNATKNPFTGKKSRNFGKHIVMPVLKHKGINKLDGIITSHFHSDHIGGLNYILSRIKTKTVIDSGKIKHHYLDYLNTIKRKKIPHIIALEKQSVMLEKNIELSIFFPAFEKKYHQNENNNSLICHLKYKNIAFIFMGDLEKELEHQLIHQNRNLLDSDIIKIGHHGSKTSTSKELLDAVTPKVAIISAGKNNRFKHPSQQTIKILQNKKIKILSTAHQGCIEFITNGQKLFYKTYSP